MAVVVLLPGLLLSPLTAAMYTATADVSPPGRRAEAYSWLATATSIGNAAGTAACGWVVDSAGVRQGLALPVVACLASAALAWVAARAATPAAEAELGSPVAARRSGG
jgi:predicted MFS family arabinose efflux permease